MSANLLPISSAGGFTTGGDITVSVYPVASPAPSISGFDSAAFANTVISGNLFLNSGYIKGGTPTVIDDGINAMYLGATTTMDVFAFPFSITARGQLVISGDITPSEAVGVWYYQSTSTNAFEIFTDSTYSTPVNSTSWAAYTGGATVQITKQIPAANIVLNTNGFLTTFNNDGEISFPGSLAVAGDIGTDGSIISSQVITTPTAYANLTATSGARAFINDGNLVAAGGASFGAQVSGGGANACPVWSDGTNWYIG